MYFLFWVFTFLGCVLMSLCGYRYAGTTFSSDLFLSIVYVRFMIVLPATSYALTSISSMRAIYES